MYIVFFLISHMREALYIVNLSDNHAHGNDGVTNTDSYSTVMFEENSSVNFFY